MEYSVKNTDEFLSALKGLKDGDTVLMEDGTYELYKSVKIKHNNITIKGNGNNVVIKGSKRIKFNESDIKNGILELDISEIAKKNPIRFGKGPYKDFWLDYDIPKPHQRGEGPSIGVYYENKPMNLSRYPKNGNIYIKKAFGEDLIESDGSRAGSWDGMFIPSDTLPFESDEAENILLAGFWRLDWAFERETVKSYDKETKIVTMNKPYHHYGYSDVKSGPANESGRFWAINAKCGFTDEGDWYVDIKNSCLYVRPFKNQNYIDVTVCNNIFEGENISGFALENVKMCEARESACDFVNCKNMTFSHLLISNVGMWGIIADWCDNLVVKNCVIHHVGNGGISASGGDRNMLKPSNCEISDNEIYETAWWLPVYMPAIEIQGVGVKVSGNYIHDLPCSAIFYQGNNHIIEKNEITRVCTQSNDAGAVYAGCDMTLRGNIIRYNYFHDITGYKGAGCVAVYFDDGMSCAEVCNNIFSNIKRMAIQLGGGRNFKIHDNIFFNCTIAMQVDFRVLTWQNNLFDRLKNHLSEIDYNSDIWKKTYPEVSEWLNDEPRLPKYNEFCNNTVIGGMGLAIWDYGDFNIMKAENNTLLLDRSFVKEQREKYPQFKIFE